MIEHALAPALSHRNLIFLNAVRGSLTWDWKIIVRLAIVLLLFATSAGLAEVGNPTPLEQRGRAPAERMCPQCHAIGKSGQSPHVGAPALRALDRRVDLDSFMERLREGLTVGHPDMPTFHFTHEDACVPALSKVHSGAVSAC